MNSIPASFIVNVVPSVLSAGGTALSLNGLMLTTNTRAPMGTILQFGNAADVATYFGPGTLEALSAARYFLGYDNSIMKPGNLLIAQYPTAAVPAYLRGAVLGLTLAALQALGSGTISVNMDGYIWPAATVVLSGATSFSNAATLMQTAMNAVAPTAASSTTGSIAALVMTVGGTITGSFGPGQTISGAGVTAGTKIVNQISGTTGQAGTYTVDTSQTVAGPIAITAKASPITVTYDSVSSGFVFTSGSTGIVSSAAYATGTLANPLNVLQADGAVLSNGAAASVPGTYMDGIVASIANWAAFETLFDPDSGSGNVQKLAFATWNNLQNNRYVYVCADTDVSPTVTVPATASLGYLLAQANMSGTELIYEPVRIGMGDFIMGAIASLNFEATNGRETFAFKSQTGLTPYVTSQSVAQNLIANGYNSYLNVATAAQQFQFYYPGSVGGPFLWLDSYVDEIWFTNACQLALMELMVNAGSIPYNSQGYGLIEAALADPINAALNFGAIREGITLSSIQKAEVNTAAGVQIDVVLSTRGWYLQVKDATPQVRAARGSPPCTLWYTDGGSIQKITLASIELQ